MSRLEEMSALEMGERLKTARNSAGKTQDDAANAIGVSRQTLISIEKGGRKVKPEELEQLAHFYGSSRKTLGGSGADHIRFKTRLSRAGAEKKGDGSPIHNRQKTSRP